MDSLEEKVENQVHFWSLLGPFLMLFSIGVLLFKASIHWYFPLSLLVGIPLCVKWKMKGMVGALACLFFLSCFAYSSIDWEERYWHVGMALAMAFSFIVLTLSLEEVQGLLQKLQTESQSRLDNFLRLDEKWQFAEKEWVAEKGEGAAQVAALNQQIEKLGEEKQTFYKLAQLAKDELLQMRSQYDLLRQELIYKKQEVANLYERLDETDRTLQGFVDSNAEKQIEDLTHQLACLQAEQQEAKAFSSLKQEECGRLQEEKAHLEKALERYEKERDELSRKYRQECLFLEQEIQSKQEGYQSILGAFKGTQKELEAKAEKFNLLQKECEHIQRQLNEQQLLVCKREEQLHQLEKLRLTLEQNLEGCQAELVAMKEKLPYAPGNTRGMEAMYIQLRQQFEEKSDLLDATRRELFKAQEEILKWQKENEEEHRFAFSECEQEWQAHLLAWGQKYACMEEEVQKEMDQLSELVRFLLGQSSKQGESG